MRTATLVALHKALTAVACGKATISSSARTKIGASMSDSRARRPSAGKQPCAPADFHENAIPPSAGSRRRANRPCARSSRRTLRSAPSPAHCRAGSALNSRGSASSDAWMRTRWFGHPPERHTLDRSTCANCAKSMQVRRPRIILKTIKEGGSNGRS